MHEFNQIFKEIGVGLVIINKDLEITAWNRWMEIHSGKHASDVIGHPLFELYPNLNQQAITRTIRSVFTFGNYAYFSQKLHSYLFPMKNITGSLQLFPNMQQQCSVGPIRDDDNRITAVFITVQDVTGIAVYEHQLKRLVVQADAANRAKSEFLANMSHELRTPLNGLLGMAELLRFTSPTPEQEEYIYGMQDSADNLLQIINDILDISKIEAGKVELEECSFSLAQLLETVVASHRPAALKKGLHLTCTLQPDFPEFVCGDQLRIKQIILNLLSNAIKFTSIGSITVDGTVVEQTGNRYTIQLSVCDTGIGMTSDTIARIFMPFEQADSSTTRCFGGTGLGLAISQKLVELMGGEIKVSSTPGTGSCFILELTLTGGSEQQLSTSQQNAAEATSSPCSYTVLIAEDNQINQRTIEMLLQKMGHKTICAGNGQQAIDIWKTTPVDLIIMDIQMPVLDGVEAVRIIRQDEQNSNRHTPVLALTADVMKATRDSLKAHGFDHYASKPVRSSDLREAFTLLLKSPPVHNEYPTRQNPLTISPESQEDQRRSRC